MSDVRDFGAVGDGKADDTAAIQHALDNGDGTVSFSRGDYRITRPLVVDLAKRGRAALHGQGGVARLLMHGAGPAIRIHGTHGGTADPGGFRPEVWERERMPTIGGLEIEGRHPEADGVQLVGVMQPTLTGLLIRRVRTAVHVTGRARNVIVDHCHLYHNTGVGLHLDRVNLHQINVTGNHISYCRLGGIRVDASEIRNLQITGNDVEYNNNRSHGLPDADAVPTAEIYVDTGDGSVREGTIAGNTLQATFSPGGANIRFIGRSPDENHKAGMWTISGNLIGSQEVNIHLTSVREVTITGNHVYSGHRRNLLVENCRNVVVGSNVFGHNPDYGPDELCTGLRFEDSEDLVLSGTQVQDCRAGRHTVRGAPELEREGLVEFVRCRRVTMTGTQVLDGAPYGVALDDCRDSLLSGCTVLDTRVPKLMKAAVRWTGPGAGNLIAACRLGSGSAGSVLAEDGVRLAENVLNG